jgi:N-acetylneuraminate synthase
MHCVGEYPTPPEHSNLARIDHLRRLLGNVQIGISTHESPDQRSIVPYAIAKGCTIVEKHVDVLTDDHTPNLYSVPPEKMMELVQEVDWVLKSIQGKPTNEKEVLGKLKRGVYMRHGLRPGETLTLDDVYYAMPCQEGQLNASEVDQIVGIELTERMKRDAPVPAQILHDMIRDKKVAAHLQEAAAVLDSAGIKADSRDEVELSTHYGLDRFGEVGALIINKVNREYCKKLIVMTPGQCHPSHHHVRKEETFELLWGDCTLTLNGRDVVMEQGHPVLISREVEHSFKTQDGCVVEEISTTHFPGDSIYEDPNISRLELKDRKVYTRFPKRLSKYSGYR